MQLSWRWGKREKVTYSRRNGASGHRPRTHSRSSAFAFSLSSLPRLYLSAVRVCACLRAGRGRWPTINKSLLSVDTMSAFVERASFERWRNEN